MFWQFFSFPIKVVLKFSENGLLTIALKASVSMTFNFFSTLLAKNLQFQLKKLFLNEPMLFAENILLIVF